MMASGEEEERKEQTWTSADSESPVNIFNTHVFFRYRAKVEAIQSGNASILYIDYGNVSTV